MNFFHFVHPFASILALVFKNEVKIGLTDVSTPQIGGSFFYSQWYNI
jgi:hypothetical protein